MHCIRRAASRAAWTAGSSRAISTAMIAMTTSNSMRVKPRLRRRGRFMRGLRFEGWEDVQKTDAARRAEGRERWLGRMGQAAGDRSAITASLRCEG